jgi:hypothetical protein
LKVAVHGPDFMAHLLYIHTYIHRIRISKSRRIRTGTRSGRSMGIVEKYSINSSKTGMWNIQTRRD